MRRSPVNAALGSGLLVAATMVVAASPQEPARPAFRGGVDFVSVDVFPRRDGVVVQGLTPDDFQILEDGVPQRVETFEFVERPPNPTDEERRDPDGSRDAEAQAADPHNRLFVVYLDLAHTRVPASYAARQPVVDFLTRTIGATDLFAFMTAEVPIRQMVFGRRTEAIEDQLTRYWTWGESERGIFPRTPYERRLVQCIVPKAPGLGERLVMLSREEALMNSLDGLMLRLGGLRDERKNVLFISEGWEPQGPQPSLTSVTEGDVPSIGIGTPTTNQLGQGTRAQGNDDLSWCDQEAGRLGAIDFRDRFRTLLASANQANVTFYPVDVGGLKTGVADASARSADATSAAASRGRGAMETLRTLADNTDGFAVVGTNDLSGGVRRIQDDLASYYLLGYYSTNATHDGRYRHIEVTVTSPGVSVSARRGYFAPTVESLAADAEAAAAPSAVDVAFDRLTRLRPEAEVFGYGVPTSEGLDVTVELSREAARRRWPDGADVQVVASAEGQADLAATGRIAGGDRSTTIGLPATASRPDAWRLAVSVTGDGGSVRDQFALTPEPARLVGLPRPFRATPSPRSPRHPVADFQFAVTERLHVEWTRLQPEVSCVARLVGRDGQPLGPDLPLTAAAAPDTSTALDLPLGSLSAGDFAIELTATSPDGETERRVLAFRVTR